MQDIAVSQRIARPRAVLFDLFHTLVCVPSPAMWNEPSVGEILGVSESQWRQLFYDEDRFGRGIGRVRDGVEAMRLVTHAIDPTVSEGRILAAVESRRRRFESALTQVEAGVLQALDRLHTAGIRTAVVSDVGADDVECWDDSPIATRIDAVAFSCDLGVCKPSARIYEHALQALDVTPVDAIFVGDGGSNEHRGASDLGMSTALVTRLLATWWPEKIQGRRGQTNCRAPDMPGPDRRNDSRLSVGRRPIIAGRDSLL